jgi:hypothetical protein
VSALGAGSTRTVERLELETTGNRIDERDPYRRTVTWSEIGIEEPRDGRVVETDTE